MRSPWPLTLRLVESKTNACAPRNQISYGCSWYITFTRTWGNCLFDLLQPKSDQFISSQIWKNPPRGVLEILWIRTQESGKENMWIKEIKKYKQNKKRQWLHFFRNSLFSAFLVCPKQEPKYYVSLCSYWFTKVLVQHHWSNHVLVQYYWSSSVLTPSHWFTSVVVWHYWLTSVLSWSGTRKTRKKRTFGMLLLSRGQQASMQQQQTNKQTNKQTARDNDNERKDKQQHRL